MIRHNICLKTVLYFCKLTVLKVLCYQNIYADKHVISFEYFYGEFHLHLKVFCPAFEK